MAQGAGLLEILVLVLLLVAGLPLVILAVERLAALASDALSKAFHALVIAGLVALAIAPPLARTLGLGLRGWIALASASVVLTSLVYTRFIRFRQFLAWTALAAPFCAIAFLFFSPVRDLVLPRQDGIEAKTARSRVPVFVLMLDELQLGSLLTPEGQVDHLRYPNFARLAKLGTWYSNATTTGESTQWAIPSLLTGRWLKDHKTPIARSYPANLFAYVKRSQPIYASEFVTRICPPRTCKGAGEAAGLASLLLDTAVVYGHYALPRDVAESSLPALTGRWAGFARPEPVRESRRSPGDIDGREHQQFRGWLNRDLRSDQIDRFETMLRNVTAKNSPALWYLHLAMPHIPWRFLPSMQTYEDERAELPGIELGTWVDSQALATHGLQRYLLQLGFTDGLLGRLIEHLESNQLFEQSLLIVAADHGVSFHAGQSRRLLTDDTLADTVPVPLFVKYPMQATGSVDGRNAELVDVLPTILEVMGIDTDERLDGTSLRRADPHRQTKQVFSADSGLHVFGPSIDGLRGVTQRISSLFGPAGSPDDLYAFGPHRALIGSTVSTRAVPPGKGSPSVRLKKPEAYDFVDPVGPFVPSLVTGSIEGDLDGEEPVAVSLNGRVAGVGWTYKQGGRIKFGIMLSPRFFVEGRNDVAVYRILGDGRLKLLPRLD